MINLHCIFSLQSAREHTSCGEGDVFSSRVPNQTTVVWCFQIKLPIWDLSQVSAALVHFTSISPAFSREQNSLSKSRHFTFPWRKQQMSLKNLPVVILIHEEGYPSWRNKILALPQLRLGPNGRSLVRLIQAPNDCSASRYPWIWNQRNNEPNPPGFFVSLSSMQQRIFLLMIFVALLMILRLVANHLGGSVGRNRKDGHWNAFRIEGSGSMWRKVQWFAVRGKRWKERRS